MTRKTVLWSLVLLACLPVAGFARQSPQVPKPVPSPAVQAPVAADAVVAKVLGESITEKQVLNLIDQLANTQNPQLTPEQMQQKNSTFFKEALDTLIGGILLKNEGREKGIVAEKAKVDEAMKSVKSRFPNEEAYQKALAAQGIKEDDVRRSIEDRLLIQQVLNEYNKNLLPPGDADIQKFYNDNPKYFEQPEQIHAAVIFLKANAEATPEEKAETKKKLESIRADIEGGKITFAEAAVKYSDDKKTSANGGDLGMFKRGDMLAVIENAAFATKPGMMTPVVESPFGYHLLSILEVKQPGIAPLDANIRTSIKNFLEQKANQDNAMKHLRDLRAKVDVEIVMTAEEWNKRHTGK
jgi:peptidyl-prolyl cis-trans isomerase C